MDRSRWLGPVTGNQQKPGAQGQWGLPAQPPAQQSQQQGAVPGSHWMPYKPQTMSDSAYGAGANSAASQAGSYYGYLGQSDQARHGAQAAVEQAKYGYMGQEAQARYGAQSGKDQSLFNSMANFGIANQNAVGQYGVSRNNALMNQSVAAANAYNQMGASWMNTMGQLGQSMAGMAAAAGGSIADTNKYGALGELGRGVVNGGMYNSQMGPITAGNLNFPSMHFGGFGGGGGGGFQTSGPEGGIADGRYGGFRAASGGGGGRQPMTPPPPPYVGGGGGGMMDPSMPFKDGTQFLRDVRGDLNNRNSFANRAMDNMGTEFGMNRAGIMDNSILNSLNANYGMGLDAFSQANSSSDYGFNTQFAQPTNYGRRASQFSNDSDYWRGKSYWRRG